MSTTTPIPVLVLLVPAPVLPAQESQVQVKRVRVWTTSPPGGAAGQNRTGSAGLDQTHLRRAGSVMTVYAGKIQVFYLEVYGENFQYCLKKSDF